MAIKRKTKSKAKAKRKAAPKRAAAKRKTAAPKAPARKVAARPKAAPKPKAAAPAEERLGVVTHYYNHLGVAIVKLETGTLRVGDRVHVKGHTSDFVQAVESLQIEHASVEEVKAGDEFGLKVAEHAREHDVVFRAARG
jgi:translation elongation factor EF-Tu-like GTPase